MGGGRTHPTDPRLRARCYLHEMYQVYYRLNMPRQREDIYGLGPEDRLRALGDNRDRAKVGVRSRALAILNLMTNKTKQKHANHQ